MPNHTRSVILLVFLGATGATAQNNRLLVHDPLTGITDTLAVDQPVDLFAAFMPHSSGALSGLTPLPQVTYPAAFPGTGLARPPHAALTYPITHYPIRTAGSLRLIQADSTRHGCSGQLVGPRHMYTARHCVLDMGQWRQGTLGFFPVFDEGMPSVFGSVTAVQYIVPEQISRDHALIELAEPIGDELGWLGLAFTVEEGFYDERIIHKFSYPSTVSTADTDLVYTGDTLFHFSTPMTVLQPTPPMLGVPGWTGVRGESGSGVWVASDTGCHVLGVLSGSTNYRHVLLDAGTFHQFRRVLAGTATSVASLASTDRLRCFPNPMASTTCIEFDGNGPHQLTLLDAMGRVLRHDLIHGSRYMLERGELPSGAYLLRSERGDAGSSTLRILMD